jgi:hypothetical protein
MSWMIEYSWDGHILRETKSESKSKLEQKLVLQQNCDSNRIIFLVQILRDLSKLKDQIKKGWV